MKRLICFGAGDAGWRASNLLVFPNEIIAYVDQDVKKRGEYLNGIKIISPDEIYKYEYDVILITSSNVEGIKKLLIEEFNINPQSIMDNNINNFFDTRIGTLRLLSDEIYENNVNGEVAELGVYKGEFAQYLNDIFYDRRLYLFDTFEGFDVRDINIEENQSYSESKVGDYYNNDIEYVLEKMRYRDNCVVKKGYFPESAVDVQEKFCLVSIDVDLYKPILDGLEFFYPKMVKGGYILIHDYNSTRFKGVKSAVRKFCEQNDIQYVPISDMCGSIVIVKN